MLEVIHETPVHRANLDGTVSSFCKECMTRIAKAHWEAELEVADQNHICDPARLRLVKSSIRADVKRESSGPDPHRGSLRFPILPDRK
jgi:hypothetical protein